MMVNQLAGFVFGIALLSLVGCQSTTGKTAGQTVDDATITTSVQSKLSSDRISNFSRIDVDTERGVVTLNGVVKSSDQKMRVAELAREVNGVKSVKNNLQIQAP
ncbi:MAG: putative periplasmic or secreted lipoprotein [Nitrospira sp.]|jgi:osmotically-inducible protein OsmY|nr:putative periplasmic or secreted lipoprotein [Nitrospira sp.]